MSKRAFEAFQRGFAPAPDPGRMVPCRGCSRQVALNGGTVARCLWCGMTWDTADGLVRGERKAVVG